MQQHNCMTSRDGMRKYNLYHGNPTADGSLSFPRDDASHKFQDDKNCFAMSLVSLGQAFLLVPTSVMCR